jgi:hypothetical protein
VNDQPRPEVAAAHRRVMNQEAIVALDTGLPGVFPPNRPGVEESRGWLEREIWSLPVRDPRSADEILGYDDDGLCR